MNTNTVITGQSNCMDFMHDCIQSFMNIKWELQGNLLGLDLFDAKNKVNRISYLITDNDSIIITLNRD